MKYCAQCGKELQDDVQFCVYCGASANSETANFAEEKEFLDATHRFLKYERICWNIFGIFSLVMSGIFLLFTLLAVVGASSMIIDAQTEAVFGLGIVSFMMVLYCLLFVPFAVIGLVCASRIKRYMNEMYTDIRSTADRCGSIGLIVLGAFFNNIAMIFYIINFARFKSNKKIVERIIQRQQSGNNQA